MIWHSSNIDEVLNEFSVDSSKGLANGVADERIEVYGKNILKNIEPVSFKKALLKQLKSGWVIALIIIAVISFFISLIYNRLQQVKCRQ